MHHANYFYGHAHVLADYCAMPDGDPPRIQGYLQHGWNIGDGLAPGTPYVAGSPIYVWSERTRRRAWSQGRRNAIVVGAPWIYLLAQQPSPAQPPSPVLPPREGTIWYPFHAWESQRVQGNHRRLIDMIKEVEAGPVTICLYWLEYDNAAIRSRYERAGFRVICHGRRGRNFVGTDMQFLHRQLAEQSRHRRVASNRLTSAVLYGILAGCEPAIYGDPMTLDDEDRTFGGNARIRAQWTELHGTQVDLATARQIARDELGARYRATPEELRHQLGWASAGVQ